MSLRTCYSFFLLGCLVEMLVNAGQEMDSARDGKYKFRESSFNMTRAGGGGE